MNIAKDEEPDEVDLGQNNPYILSTTNSVGPFSFVDFRQSYDHASPPPKYLEEDTLMLALP